MPEQRYEREKTKLGIDASHIITFDLTYVSPSLGEEVEEAMKWSPSGFFCILYFLVAVPQSLGWATKYFGPTRMNIISSRTIISQRRTEASLPLVSLKAKSNVIPDDYEDRESRKKSRRRRMSVGAILASSFLNLLGFTMTGKVSTHCKQKIFDSHLTKRF